MLLNLENNYIYSLHELLLETWEQRKVMIYITVAADYTYLMNIKFSARLTVIFARLSHYIHIIYDVYMNK